MQPHPASIPLDQLQLALVTAKARKRNSGRTGQFCVLTAAPVVQVDCHTRWARATVMAEARYRAPREALMQPMMRGHINTLYQRVRREHGLAEVRRTWRTGIKALLAEPAYVLNGGEATA